MNKLCSLPKLPDNIILCTVDVVGLYPNIPHEEGLSAIRKRGDFKNETITYFEVQDPKFSRFCLLPKIHKRLNNAPDRLAISNCGNTRKKYQHF